MKLHPADHKYYTSKPPEKDPDTRHCNSLYQVKAGPWKGQWTYCDNLPGEDTSTPGRGRCRFHYGLDGKGISRRYRFANSPEIRERTKDHFEAEQPLDLYEDLAAMRALLEATLENYLEEQSALILFYRSFESDNRGLHDAPLYHTMAFSRALETARENGEDLADCTLKELNRRLDSAAEDYKRDWAERKDKSGLREPVFKAVRPDKYESPVELTKMFKTVQDLVLSIGKQEQDRYLSKPDFEEMVYDLVRISRHTLSNFIRTQAEELLSRLREAQIEDPDVRKVLLEWSRDGTGVERATGQLREGVNERLEKVLSGPLGE